MLAARLRYRKASSRQRQLHDNARRQLNIIQAQLDNVILAVLALAKAAPATATGEAANRIHEVLPLMKESHWLTDNGSSRPWYDYKNAEPDPTVSQDRT